MADKLVELAKRELPEQAMTKVSEKKPLTPKEIEELVRWLVDLHK